MARKYQHKGDSFSRRVLAGKGPRTVRALQHWRSGREYFARVLVEDCGYIHAQQVRALLPAEDVFNLAGGYALEWWPERATYALRPLSEAEGFQGLKVGLVASVTGKGTGFRLWLKCPHCARRCAAVYASDWNEQGQEVQPPVCGCRACLGLSDFSRQRHKCPDWVGRVVRGQYQSRGPETLFRARHLQVRSLGQLASRILEGLKAEDQEVKQTLEFLADSDSRAAEVESIRGRN